MTNRRMRLRSAADVVPRSKSAAGSLRALVALLVPPGQSEAALARANAHAGARPPRRHAASLPKPAQVSAPQDGSRALRRHTDAERALPRSGRAPREAPTGARADGSPAPVGPPPRVRSQSDPAPGHRGPPARPARQPPRPGLPDTVHCLAGPEPSG